MPNLNGIEAARLMVYNASRLKDAGHDIARDEMAVKRLINRVSVDAAFFKKLSPMENLSFAARLYGLDPNLLAHSQIIHTDVPFAAFFFTATYFFWRALNRPGGLPVALALHRDARLAERDQRGAARLATAATPSPR